MPPFVSTPFNSIQILCWICRLSPGGSVSPWYEGGQTPLFRRTPKRGFKNFFREPLNVINIGKLVHWIEAGRIDPTNLITMKILRDSRAVGRVKHGVKLLADVRRWIIVVCMEMWSDEIAPIEHAKSSSILPIGCSKTEDTIEHWSEWCLWNCSSCHQNSWWKCDQSVLQSFGLASSPQASQVWCFAKDGSCATQVASSQLR